MKSKGMENFLEAVTQQVLGSSRKENKCVLCGAEVDTTKMDGKHLKEFKISHLCKKCQDEAFSS